MTNIPAGAHLEITFDPSASLSQLPQATSPLGGGNTSSNGVSFAQDSAGLLVGQEDIAQIAEASVLGLPLTIPGASAGATATLFSGQKALYNDQALMDFISFLTKSSGRSFQSMPNGDFLAFFPDYFGWSQEAPYFNISDLEIMDLTIDVSDDSLATHVFTTTDLYHTGSVTLLDELASTVASIEDIKTFRSLTNVGDQFDPVAFMQRYGARPLLVQDTPEIKDSFLQYMYGWMQFLEQWAKLFIAAPTITFMPELYPGGRVQFGTHDLTMFIDSVTHNFDRQSGFTTEPTLIAPSTVSQGDKSFSFGMVLAENGYNNLPKPNPVTKKS